VLQSWVFNRSESVAVWRLDCLFRIENTRNVLSLCAGAVVMQLSG